MNQVMNLCDVVEREVIDERTLSATYKIKGGGYINVKSIFNNEQQFKDAIYPAVLTAIKLKQKV